MRLRYTHGQAGHIPLRLEHLEQRCLLAGDVMAADIAPEVADLFIASVHEPTLEQVSTGQAQGLHMKLRVVDGQGRETSEIAVGSEFELQLIVQDRRPDSRLKGAFAAYADVVYRSELMGLAEGAYHQKGPNYTVAYSLDASVDGLLNEWGGVSSSVTGLDNAEHLVASVRFRATAAGTARFGIDPADDLIQRGMLAYGESSFHQRTEFTGTKLKITMSDGQEVPDDLWQPPVDSSTIGTGVLGTETPCNKEWDLESPTEVAAPIVEDTIGDILEFHPVDQVFEAGIVEGMQLLRLDLTYQNVSGTLDSAWVMASGAVESQVVSFALPAQQIAQADSWSRSDRDEDDQNPWRDAAVEHDGTADVPESPVPAASIKPLF